MDIIKDNNRAWGRVVAAVLVGALTAQIGQAQVQVNRGYGRDASSQRGSGGINPSSRGYSTLGNQIISGNVGAGKSFRGSYIGNSRSFRGSLGTSSLSGFTRDSYGLSGNAGSLGVAQQFYQPSGTVLGVRDITSGRNTPGGSAPRNVNLTPALNTGPAVSQPSTGNVGRYAAPALADLRADLRAGAQRQLVDPGVVETGSNLFGIRRSGPGPGSTAGEAVYTANTARGMWSAQSPEQVRAEEDPSKSFQALPAWAKPGAGIESTTGQERETRPSLADERIEKNLQEARELIDQAAGGAGVPSIVDVYEQMTAEDAAAEAIETGPGTEGVRTIIPYAAEGPEASLRSTAEKMMVYNSFVGSRKSSFNDLMGQAEGLLKSGQYYYAARTYGRASGMRPENPLAQLGLAYSLIGAGEVISATESLGKAMELFPEQARGKIDLKGFFQNPEEFQRVTSRLEAKVDIRPNNARLRLLLGYVYYYGGQKEEAVELLKTAVELAKEDKSIPADLRMSIEKFAEAAAKESPKQPWESR